MAQEIKISDVLGRYQGFITYVPLRTEVPYADYLNLSPEAPQYKITPRATLDPEKEYLAARALTHNVPTAVLMPGRRFDDTGTRLGQGGGWYDRFLSIAPKQWLRVGFCYPDQFSQEDLARNPWDQPVDYVCVAEGEHLVVYKTNARSDIVGR